MLLSINAPPTIFPKAFTILPSTYKGVEKCLALWMEKLFFCLHFKNSSVACQGFSNPVSLLLLTLFMSGQFIWGGSGKRVVPRWSDVVWLCGCNNDSNFKNHRWWHISIYSKRGIQGNIEKIPAVSTLSQENYFCLSKEMFHVPF